jgi:N-acylglucosamine 2-epimerase
VRRNPPGKQHPRTRRDISNAGSPFAADTPPPGVVPIGASKELEMNAKKLHDQYRSLLLDGIVPFWLEHGIDWEQGGVLSCMKEDCSPVSGDKFMWSQARSVWTFSALYNRVEKRPEFLKAAENSIRFLLAHGRDEQGRWVYHTDRTGRAIEGPTSIYTDCFVVYGFSEYLRAVKHANILSVAQATFERVRRRIEEPDFHETAPYILPSGWKNHGVPMIMTETTGEFAETIHSNDLEAEADTYAARVMERFVRPKRKLLLEFLTNTYEELPPNAGTFVIPGHAIESMWFVLHRARRRGDNALALRAAEVIRWHLEAGWDKEYGGILLGISICA